MSIVRNVFCRRSVWCIWRRHVLSEALLTSCHDPRCTYLPGNRRMQATTCERHIFRCTASPGSMGRAPRLAHASAATSRSQDDRKPCHYLRDGQSESGSHKMSQSRARAAVFVRYAALARKFQKAPASSPHGGGMMTQPRATCSENVPTLCTQPRGRSCWFCGCSTVLSSSSPQ